MSKIMTNKEFSEKLLDCAINYPTRYQNGTIGQFRDGHFLFDCICLIKSILWGFNGNRNATYGGAIYASNGVPDQTLDWFLNSCSDVSSNFSNIEIGEYLWMEGHCGIYVGNGLAVECTPKWLNKVLISAVLNIGTMEGYGTRYWTRHGKLPYIDYKEEEYPYNIGDIIYPIKNITLYSTAGYIGSETNILKKGTKSIVKKYHNKNGLYMALTDENGNYFDKATWTNEFESFSKDEPLIDEEIEEDNNTNTNDNDNNIENNNPKDDTKNTYSENIYSKILKIIINFLKKLFKK